MISNPKYFVELSLECVFETTEDEKESVIEKINEAISKMIKEENAIHISINTSLISEGNLLTSLAGTMGGDFN